MPKMFVYVQYKHFLCIFDVLVLVTIDMEPVLVEVSCIHRF